MTGGELVFVIAIGMAFLFFLLAHIVETIGDVKLAKYKNTRPKVTKSKEDEDIQPVIDVNKELK